MLIVILGIVILVVWIFYPELFIATLVIGVAISLSLISIGIFLPELLMGIGPGSKPSEEYHAPWSKEASDEEYESFWKGETADT